MRIYVPNALAPFTVFCALVSLTSLAGAARAKASSLARISFGLSPSTIPEMPSRISSLRCVSACARLDFACGRQKEQVRDAHAVNRGPERDGDAVTPFEIGRASCRERV